MKYNFSKIEKKWQALWRTKKIYQIKEDPKKKKYYTLFEFPYPSGDGLHVGHIRPYVAMDVIARKRRMEGYNVLFPIGWDAFGLPTENYAIKTGIHPKIVTKKNTDNFRRQLKSIGFSFDWSREVNTTDPNYYKWTQWLFLQFFKVGLAYKAKMTINWCPKDKIGLANEEVVAGKCERCGTVVEKREKEQWMLKITAYADKLLEGLKGVDFLPEIKAQQEHWIGRSEGALIKFPLRGVPGQKDNAHSVEVFTTRPDTLFGATFIAISAELAKKWIDVGWKADEKVRKFVEETLKERSTLKAEEGLKEKLGVPVGIRAVNPANKEEIPVWVVNYVLSDVGTGAIMAVPAHDERDFEFAKRYRLSIKQVVAPYFFDHQEPPRPDAPSVPRIAVHSIVKHKNEDKYLGLVWKNSAWKTFIIGGVEKGEDLVEAAKREIHEETGYRNLKLVRKLGTQVHEEFFAKHKNENRYARFSGLLFELENEEKDPVSSEEKAKHEVVWVERAEMENFLNVGNTSKIFWKSVTEGEKAYTGEGKLINSEGFSGDSEKAKWEITKAVGGIRTVKYKLRDWVFSRQRYWGEPIPIVHCEKCGYVSVPEKDLPVKLPEVKEYKPREDGESPLASVTKWINVKCPKCGGKAVRETDTMPNWAGSSWYYLAYLMSKRGFKNSVSIENWKLQIENFRHFMPVDWYNGGMEHVTLHLLYSRFWNLFLYDQGLVPTKEPYKKRTAHGLILGEGGIKMSKSKGNVVNPDTLVKEFGADALRLYEMFLGPFAQSVAWDPRGIIGMSRFLERVWALGHEKKFEKKVKDETLERLVNRTIKKVSEDIETMSFNTAISALMIFMNECASRETISLGVWENFLLILSPFAPHLANELWQKAGGKGIVEKEVWPVWNEELLQEKTLELIIQVDGKFRDRVLIPKDLPEDKAMILASEQPNVKKWLIGKKIARVVFVPNRLINICLSK